MASRPTDCAELYQALAETLAEPPGWLSAPGCDWPLFDIVVRLAPESEAARQAVESLANIPAESLPARCARYTALFAGPSRPRFWLYESAFLTGRILGPETFVVEQLYRAAGLETAGAELPDHASLELAFLAHLAGVGQVGNLSYERQFIKEHAGRWLPELGRGLARSGDEVYAPIGRLLADWLEEALAPSTSHKAGSTPSTKRKEARRLPVISQTEACSLCGFCVQVCPTRALAVRETATRTMLALNVAICTGCGKCERVCETQAMIMTQPTESSEPLGGWTALRESPRVACPVCGRPTVSRAELNFVAGQIGHPAWLDYCLDCRPQFMENP